jgi:hypothetical protein
VKTINFVRLQLDDDERWARAAGWHQWQMGIMYGTVIATGNGKTVARDCREYDAEHIARHDPARVLREVESLRKIIDNCSDWIENPVQGWEIDRADELTLKLDVGPTLLRLLAAIFSGR